MKKKLLFTLLPLVALVGCNAKTAAPKHHFVDNSSFERGYDEETGLPTVGFRDNDSTFKTYLMLSPFGYLSLPGAPVKGDVSDEFLENTVVWTGDSGTALPGKDTVKTTVNGATFRCWALYNEDNDDNVWFDEITTVPAVEGMALKAIFDGTDAGGNSGGGSGGGGSGGGGGSTTQSGFGIMKNGSEQIQGQSKGTNFDGYDEYYVPSVSFAAGDKFALLDLSSLSTWSVNINPYSFDPNPAHPSEDPSRVASYVTKNSTDYTVKQAFKADLYIQIMYQQDRLYIELVA